MNGSFQRGNQLKVAADRAWGVGGQLCLSLPPFPHFTGLDPLLLLQDLDQGEQIKQSYDPEVSRRLQNKSTE